MDDTTLLAQGQTMKLFPIIPLAAVLGVGACGGPTDSSNAGNQMNTAPVVAAPSKPAPHRLKNWLPVANRFSDYGPNEVNRPAQDALNAGDVETAYNSFMDRDRSLDGDREKRFDDILEIAFQQYTHTTPGSDYVERVGTYWLPQLRKLPAKAPQDDAACRTVRRDLDELGQDISDAGRLTFTRKESKTVDRFKIAFRAKERLLRPSLDRQCG